MEELAKIAEAYYARLSPAQKASAFALFRSMDVNGDGSITFNEYSNYCRNRGYQAPTPGFFNMFDKNRDRALDFSEFLSLYYLSVTGRMITCDGCRAFLPGVYFTCSACFHTQITTYDLCCACFRDNRYVHNHPADVFLDSHSLLLFSRRRVLDMQHLHQQAAPIHYHHYHNQPPPPGNNTVGVGEILHGLSVGFQVASLCNIM